jgi:hypothetical protein
MLRPLNESCWFAGHRRRGMLIGRVLRHGTARHFSLLATVAIILACLPATALAAKKTQEIKFTSTAPSPATVGGSTYTVTATATSGLAVSFGSGTPTVCTVSVATVSFVGAGTCTINANQAGNGEWEAAPQKQQSFGVVKKTQEINFTSTAPGSATVGGSTYTVAATATSGLAVSFGSGTPTVCTVSGATVSLVGAGQCTIDATQAGSASYEPAPEKQQSFEVVKKAQEIKFTSTAPSPATIGGPTYAVVATATSGLTVSFTSATSTVCTVAGTTVSFIGAGKCTINANQEGNTSYNAAPQVQQSFEVVKKTQEIKFTSTAPSPAAFGGPTYTVVATATSGLTVSFSSGSPAVCTVSGSTVSFVGVGTCTVDANQAGNTNFEVAPEKQQSFEVGKGAQKITFTSTIPSAASVGGSSYTVAAEGGASHEAVTFTVASTSVCTISGTTVSFIGTGTCTIDVNQGGNADYNAAAQEVQSFTVGKGVQKISFTSNPPESAAVGSAPYTVSAEGGESHNGLKFTIDPSSETICTISGATVSFIGEGTCRIDVNQAGDSNYEPAPQKQQSFTVGQGSQMIKFTSTAPSSATVGGSTYAVAATTTSGLTVSFSSATPTVCTVGGATVSFVGAGTCTINADQAGNSGYKAALQVQQSFEVGIAIVLSPAPGPTPIVVHVSPPNSTFRTLGAVFNPASRIITFTESVAEAGTFRWLLTFQNGKFGVFGATVAKCGAGFVKLRGKCHPSKIVFSRGSSSVTSSGTVTFVLRPTTSALKALKNAFKQRKSLPVAMTLTFQSVRSASPVSRLLALTVRTR